LLAAHFAPARVLASVLTAAPASAATTVPIGGASIHVSHSQQPFQAPRRSTPLETALDYASRGIPVLPCHYPIELVGHKGPWEEGRVCSCGRLRCPSPALHPIGMTTAADATTEGVDIVCWWAATPEAGIATPAGAAVDVLEVHHPAPAVALIGRVRELGATPGPVIRAGRGCTQFLVAAGSTGATPERPDADEIVAVRVGSLVFLPPSRLIDGQRVSWARPLPDEPLLPPAEHLLPSLTEAVRTVVALRARRPGPALGW
jgi:hypothetical protein